MSTVTNTITMFVISILIMILMVTVILGFMLGFGHPLPWAIIFILVVIPYIHDKFLASHKLAWRSIMSTGIELIDHDHKRLVELINELQEATEFNVEEVQRQHILDEVVSYTKYHFSREEALMKLNNYPDFKAHQQQHRQMIREINQCLEEYGNDKSQAIDHIARFLKTWLLEHINGSDQEYVPYLKITTLAEQSMQADDNV